VASQSTYIDYRITSSGPLIKKVPSKLVLHPFSTSQSEKTNSMKLGGDKVRQKEETIARDKELSTILHRSLKHIFDSPVTEGMRVIQSDSGQAGIISFSGHQGDWFQPLSPDNYTISLGKEVPDPSPILSSPSISTQKIVSIEKLLNKAEKTLRRNGSVLICGGRGSGKTATLNELSKRMNIHLLRTP
jgi:Cdc6-like AAA superfamily ATPase